MIARAEGPRWVCSPRSGVPTSARLLRSAPTAVGAPVEATYRSEEIAAPARQRVASSDRGDRDRQSRDASLGHAEPDRTCFPHQGLSASPHTPRLVIQDCRSRNDVIIRRDLPPPLANTSSRASALTGAIPDGQERVFLGCETGRGASSGLAAPLAPAHPDGASPLALPGLGRSDVPFGGGCCPHPSECRIEQAERVEMPRRNRLLPVGAAGFDEASPLHRAARGSGRSDALFREGCSPRPGRPQSKRPKIDGFPIR